MLKIYENIITLQTEKQAPKTAFNILIFIILPNTKYA